MHFVVVVVFIYTVRKHKIALLSILAVSVTLAKFQHWG